MACNSAYIDNDKLKVVFNEAKLKQLLNNLGVSTWQGLENTVLLWLCDSDNNGAFANNPSKSQFLDALKEKYSAKRFNLMLPLMDLDDVQSVSALAVEKGDSASFKGLEQGMEINFLS